MYFFLHTEVQLANPKKSKLELFSVLNFNKLVNLQMQIWIWSIRIIYLFMANNATSINMKFTEAKDNKNQ